MTTQAKWKEWEKISQKQTVALIVIHIYMRGGPLIWQSISSLNLTYLRIVIIHSTSHTPDHTFFLLHKKRREKHDLVYKCSEYLVRDSKLLALRSRVHVSS